MAAQVCIQLDHRPVIMLTFHYTNGNITLSGRLMHRNPVLGGGLRGAVRIFSGWDNLGLRKRHRLRSLLRLPKRPFVAHPQRPQTALPVRVPASGPPCHCGHLRLGR